MKGFAFHVEIVLLVIIFTISSLDGNIFFFRTGRARSFFTTALYATFISAQPA